MIKGGYTILKFAIFDVDLTLTSKDTFIEFYKFLCQEDKRFLIYLGNVLYSGLMYGLNFYDERKAKERYLSFLKGVSFDAVDEIGKKFFESWVLKKLIFKDGLLEIQKCKKLGFKTILISASPEFYLNNFSKMHCVDYVLATRYEVKNGLYTGKMIGRNNKGQEKVLRFYEFLNKNGIVDFDHDSSRMYSDSTNDLPLFNLVGNRFLINSRYRASDILNLRWE